MDFFFERLQHVEVTRTDDASMIGVSIGCIHIHHRRLGGCGKQSLTRAGSILCIFNQAYEGFSLLTHNRKENYRDHC